MAKFSLVFKKSIAKDLRRIPKHSINKILERIAALAIDPRPAGAEKLSNQEKYRVRQGAYRIIYEIKDKQLLVVVVKVGHRRNVYKSN